MRLHFFSSATIAIIVYSCNTQNSLQKQVDEVYSRLTIEEKTAQLCGIYPSELMVDGKRYPKVSDE